MSNPELKSVVSAIRAVTGKDINPSTAWRWFKSGVAGIKLEVWYIGRQPQTTDEAVQTFVSAVTKARLEKKTRRVADATSEELEAAGLNRPAKAGC